MDFQQGLITTIHEYGVTRNLLKELNKSLKKRSTSILIPCLYEEFERPALKDIREVLKNLTGLNELVIALSAKTVEQVKSAKSFFDSMPIPVHVQWTNSPSVIELLKSQEKNGLENKRLCVLQKSNDGFYIAEKDLELRGPGQILGYKQSGLPDFVLDNLPNNKFLIEKAREEAIKVVSDDPDLKENIVLRNILIDTSDNKFIHDFLN